MAHFLKNYRLQMSRWFEFRQVEEASTLKLEPSFKEKKWNEPEILTAIVDTSFDWLSGINSLN